MTQLELMIAKKKHTLNTLNSILNDKAYQPQLDLKDLITNYYYGEKEDIERLEKRGVK